MREQPDGVRRVRRGDGDPAPAYDIYVDDGHAGWVERVRPGRVGSSWRAYPDGGPWPKMFGRPAAYLAAVEWLVELHRAAQAKAEQVESVESGSVAVLAPVVADPFGGEPFADPLAP